MWNDRWIANLYSTPIPLGNNAGGKSIQVYFLSVTNPENLRVPLVGQTPYSQKFLQKWGIMTKCLACQNLDPPKPTGNTIIVEFMNTRVPSQYYSVPVTRYLTLIWPHPSNNSIYHPNTILQ